MLGSRFLGDPIAGGMPRWKYVSNRFLTTVENVAFGLHLTEYHTGLRAYSRRLLETIPYHLNSDDFVFDQELIAQVVAAGGLPIGEIAVPTRYFEEASSVGFRRSVVYGLSTLRVVARFLLHRSRLRRSPKLTLPAARGLRSGREPRRRRPRPRPSSGSRSRSSRWRYVLRGVDLGPDVRTSCGPRSRPGSPLMVALQLADIAPPGVRWQRLVAPIRCGPLPADARLPARRLPRQQHPAGPARRARPEPLPRRPRGDQPGVGARDGRRRAGRRHRRSSSRSARSRSSSSTSAASSPAPSSSASRSTRPARRSGSPSGSSPTGCPGPTGSSRFAERRPRIAELGRRLQDGLAVARRPRTLGGAIALSVVAWGASLLAVAAAGQAIGLELTIGEAALLASGVALATAIPSAPGYLGTFELAFVTIAARPRAAERPGVRPRLSSSTSRSSS